MHTVTLSEGQRLSSSSDGADTPAPGTVEAQRKHTTDIACQIAEDARSLRELIQNIQRHSLTGEDEEGFTDCKLRGAELLAARMGFFAEQIQRLHGDTARIFMGDLYAWIAPDRLYTACSDSTPHEFHAINRKGAA